MTATTTVKFLLLFTIAQGKLSWQPICWQNHPPSFVALTFRTDWNSAVTIDALIALMTIPLSLHRVHKFGEVDYYSDSGDSDSNDGVVRR